MLNNRAVYIIIALILIVAIGLMFVKSRPVASPAPDQAVEGTTSTSDTVSVNEAMEPANLATQKYAVNTATTSLKWSSERIVGNAHTGTVPVAGGEVVLVDNNLVSGSFEIDLTKITDEGNNERLLKHLSSDDFFNTAVYPTASLTVTSVEALPAADNFTVTADLKIKGKSNQITFPAEIKRDGDSVVAAAKFSIDRTKWGIVYDSGTIVSSIGDRAIRDNIDFELNLVLNPQQ